MFLLDVWELPSAVSAPGALVLLCVCAVCGPRSVSETLDAWLFLRVAFPRSLVPVPGGCWCAGLWLWLGARCVGVAKC